MQRDINNCVIRDRINNASFRQKVDPIKKNILRRQNPLKIVFEDISNFDAENPIVGSLLREFDGEKKLTAGDLLKKAPRPPAVDFAIKNRLNKLKERKNNTSPPPTPLPHPFFSPSPPLPPPLPPSSFPFNCCHHHPIHLHQLIKFFHHTLYYLHDLQVFVFQPNQHFHQIIFLDPKHKH